jgi:type IV pilus assembly protein PilA
VNDPSPVPQPLAPPKRGLPLWFIALITLPVLFFLLPIFLVVAIYGVRKYVVNAKLAEARSSLAAIARDAAGTYDPRDGFCPSASRPVPADPSSVSGTKYQSAPANWDEGRSPLTGFACLKFSLETPQYYQYSYTASGAHRSQFKATARGDLNGDGTFSTFTLRGKVGPGGAVEIEPTLEEDRPEE